MGARVTVTSMHDEATVRFEVQFDGQKEAEGEEAAIASQGSAGRGESKGRGGGVESEGGLPVPDEEDSRNDSSRTTTDSEDTDQEQEEVSFASSFALHSCYIAAIGYFLTWTYVFYFRRAWAVIALES